MAKKFISDEEFAQIGGGGAPSFISDQQFAQTQQQDTSFRDLPGNILPSAGRAIGDIFQAVKQPLKTAGSIADLAGGALQAALPGDFQPKNPTQAQNKAAFEGFKGFLSQRYGSVENARSTIINDPVGAALDVAGIATGTGGLLRAAGTRAPGLARAGGAIGAVGRAVDPTRVVTAPLS